LTEGPTLFAPARHPVLSLDVNQKRLQGILRDAHEHNPQDFETLLGLEGVGPATVRSLSLLAEIIFQAPPARRDPTSCRILIPRDWLSCAALAEGDSAGSGKSGNCSRRLPKELAAVHGSFVQGDVGFCILHELVIAAWHPPRQHGRN
jgi:hypothetical protein